MPTTTVSFTQPTRRIAGILAKGVAALGLAGALAGNAAAQAFPSRPITLIYPYAAGATADQFMRLMAVEVSKTLGQPVVMEYRPGAGGRLGYQAQAKARGDGHLLQMAAIANTVTLPLTDTTFQIEPGKDYTPIWASFLGPFVLVANAGLPFRDVKGLVAYAKANPKTFTGGNTGIGGIPHLAMLMLAEQSGIDLPALSYKGEGEITPALLGNQVQAAFTSTALKTHIDAGKLMALAVCSTQRLPLMPNVPTVTEAGVPYLNNLGFWVGIVAPPETPRDVVMKIHDAYAPLLKDPAMLKRIADAGYVPLGGSPEDFTNLIRTDLNRLRPLFQKLKLN